MLLNRRILMIDFINDNLNIILFFLISQFVNVFIATIKSVLLINGTKLKASIFNALSFSINVFIIKSISSLPLEITIPVTIISNSIAVYFSLWFLEKIRKDKLWKITAIVPAENLDSFKKELLEKEANFVVYTTTWQEYKVIDIFSSSKKESDIVSAIFKKFKIKYIVNANDGFLQ
jgi:hypothetical protein